MKIAKDIQYNLDREALFNKLVQDGATDAGFAWNGFIRLTEKDETEVENDKF